MVATTMDQLVALCKRRGFIFRIRIFMAVYRACMITVRWGWN